MNASANQNLQEDEKTPENLNNPAFLGQLRAQMLAYARSRIADEQLAEDAVQEALAGAFKNAADFGRRSALKTWVFSILKNKITDIYRRKETVPEDSIQNADTDDDAIMDSLFDERGFWKKDERPVNWSLPMESAQNEQFWRIFETCLEGLPENQSHLFMMRELLDRGTPEICESAGITVSNLHTTLFRARLRLRECLENRWFMGEEHL